MPSISTPVAGSKPTANHRQRPLAYDEDDASRKNPHSATSESGGTLTDSGLDVETTNLLALRSRRSFFS